MHASGLAQLPPSLQTRLSWIVGVSIRHVRRLQARRYTKPQDWLGHFLTDLRRGIGQLLGDDSNSRTYIPALWSMVDPHLWIAPGVLTPYRVMPTTDQDYKAMRLIVEQAKSLVPLEPSEAIHLDTEGLRNDLQTLVLQVDLARHQNLLAEELMVQLDQAIHGQDVDVPQHTDFVRSLLHT